MKDSLGDAIAKYSVFSSIVTAIYGAGKGTAPLSPASVPLSQGRICCNLCEVRAIFSGPTFIRTTMLSAKNRIVLSTSVAAGFAQSLLRAAAIAILPIMFSGCAITALNPHLDPDRINKAGTSDSWIEKCTAKAKACAQSTLEEFSELAKRSGDFDRILGYGLVGAGTAAAALAASSNAHTQAIKNIAIGVAGLLGIRTVANTDGQRTLLVQAQAVVNCMVRTYDAIGTAAGTPESRKNMRQELSGEKSALNEQYETANQALQPASKEKARSAELSSQPVELSTGAQVLRGLQRDAGVQRVNSAQNLIDALSTADNSKDQALAQGVLEVRLYVQNHLNNPPTDLSSLFTVQQNNVTKMAGSVVSAKKTAGVDATVSDRVGSQPGTPGGGPSTTDQLKKDTDPLQQVYSSCSGIQS